MENLLLIIFSAIISIPFILLEILIDKWLVKQGYMRTSKKIWWVFIGIYSVILAKQFFLKDLSWWITSSIILLGSVFASNRYELNQSFQKGKWWWIPEEKKKKKRLNSI